MKHTKTIHPTKRIVSLILALVLLALSVPPVFAAGTVESGYCGGEWVDDTYGKNLKWKLNSKGVLTISGKGSMEDYGVINESPFNEAGEVKKIVIKEGVTTIGERAFFAFAHVKSVEIAKSITTIGKEAFYYCDSLPSISIPASVKHIGKDAFAICRDLKKFHVDSKNKYYRSDKAGCLYDKKQTTLIQFPSASPKMKYTLPKSVKKICDYAFNECHNLKEVVLPKSVKSIGKEAFYYCDELEYMQIPAGVKSIGALAFAWCRNIEAFSVAAKNKHYASDKYGCLCNKSRTKLIQYPCGSTKTKLRIPGTVKSIEEAAFSGTYYLKRVTIPANVETIWREGFRSSSITSVVFEDGVTYIGEEGFAYCDELEEVTLPNTLFTLGKDLFYSCDNLTSITIPASVTRIKESAFDECTALETVHYTGTKAQWENISIESYNECLLNAALSCAG